ncbi:hypothetical protein DFJ43DRAFT_253264, partial [Lentinula guzmanii]
IAKATANYGLPATRPIYERALEVLPDRHTAEMCLRFAALERKLGEIDRARAIYAHASQFCDPRVNPQFWSEWNAFEYETGSEDTFREISNGACRHSLTPRRVISRLRLWLLSKGPDKFLIILWRRLLTRWPLRRERLEMYRHLWLLSKLGCIRCQFPMLPLHLRLHLPMRMRYISQTTKSYD